MGPNPSTAAWMGTQPAAAAPAWREPAAAMVRHAQCQASEWGPTLHGSTLHGCAGRE